MSMIIGRKQIILAALIVALGAAIFLNYRYSSAGTVATAAKGKTSTSKSLGDAAYVDNQNVSESSDVFAAAKLSRQQTRDTAKEVLQSIVSNTKATAAEKKKAVSEIETISKNIQNEGDIETLVKAKGFQDCVAIINNNNVRVVVKAKSNAFSASDIAQIKDIVVSQTSISPSKITIVEAQ